MFWNRKEDMLLHHILKVIYNCLVLFFETFFLRVSAARVSKVGSREQVFLDKSGLSGKYQKYHPVNTGKYGENV